MLYCKVPKVTNVTMCSLSVQKSVRENLLFVCNLFADVVGKFEFISLSPVCSCKHICVKKPSTVDLVIVVQSICETRDKTGNIIS